MMTTTLTLEEKLKLAREALEKIALGEGCYGAQAFEYKEIAREALESLGAPIPDAAGRGAPWMGQGAGGGGRDSERIALAARHFFTLVDAACRHGGFDRGQGKSVTDVAAEALAGQLGAGLVDVEAALCEAGARWAGNGERGWEREAWRRAATGWPKASPQPRWFSVKIAAKAAARRAMKEIP